MSFLQPRFKRPSALLVLTAAVLTTGLRAGEVQKMIPADVLACVYIRNYTQLESQWMGTFVYKFTQDPQVANFIQPIRSQLDELSKEAEAGGQKALLKNFKGEMAFLIGSLSYTSGQPDAAMAIVAEHSGDPAVIQNSLLALIQKEGKVESQSSEDFMGVKIYSLKVVEESSAPIPDSNPGAPRLARQETTPVHFTVLPHHLIFTMGENKLVKQIVQMNKQPGGATLFESADFKNCFTGDYSAFPLIAYVNIQNVAKVADSVVRENSPTASLSGLGLDSLSSLGVAVSLKPDQIETWSVLNVPGPKTGVAKLLFPAEQPDFQQALALIPYDASSFSITNFSIPDLWAVVKQAVAAFSPQSLQMIDMTIQQVNMTQQFNLENDLIGSLGAELIQFTKPGMDGQSMPSSPMASNPFGGLGMNLDNAVIMLSLKDRARFAAAMDKLLEYMKMMTGGQSMVEKQGFMGFPLYKVGSGAPPAMPGEATPTPTGPDKGFAITARYFVFASNLEDVKQVVRASQGKGSKSILENSEFAPILAETKGRNIKSLSWTSSDAMKQVSTMLSQMSMLASMDPKNPLNEMFNFAAVPPPAVFQKYFGSQKSTSELNGDKIIGHYLFKAGK
ncbi:MAG: hypothetical protein Kow0059_03110 [Candidatus Sumerlaeia bacterium]